MPAETPKRILLVKLSAIGDVLMATPSAKAIRQTYPDSYIAWIVERKSADVVLGNPYLDEVIVWDRVKGNSLLSSIGPFVQNLMSLRHLLRALQFDVAIDMQGLLRSATVCVASGAPRRVGFSDAAEGSVFLYSETHTPDADDLNAQQRNLDILQKIGVHSRDTAMYMPLTDDDRKFAGQFWEENGLVGEKVVVFLPATTWVNKHWVNESWSKVADVLGERGVKSVILGSKADIWLAETISVRTRHKPVIAAGRTTLKQAGALMERSTAVVGVDTGLLHMAVALDRPSVGLFGASVWRCFLKKDNFVWLSKDFPCSPCLRHPTCKNVDCMAAITSEDVVSAVSPWLK